MTTTIEMRLGQPVGTFCKLNDGRVVDATFHGDQQVDIHRLYAHDSEDVLCVADNELDAITDDLLRGKFRTLECGCTSGARHCA